VKAAPANDIEFRSVTKRYGSVTAVSDINLAVPKGAFVARCWARPAAARPPACA
jgi:spermidine/putrescine transport system ATP-binding protein